MSEQQAAQDGAAEASLEVRPQAILEMAAQLFGQQGFQKTSIDEIARLSGVSVGTVYYYFKSKDRLLETVQLRSIKAWRQATHSAAREAPDSRAARLAASLRASAAYAMKDSVIRGILAGDTRVLLPHSHKAREAVKESLNIEYSLSLGVLNGELRADLDIDRVAEAIRLIHDAMIRELFTHPAWARPVDDTARIEALIDLVIHGICARSKEE